MQDHSGYIFIATSNDYSKGDCYIVSATTDLEASLQEYNKNNKREGEQRLGEQIYYDSFFKVNKMEETIGFILGSIETRRVKDNIQDISLICMKLDWLRKHIENICNFTNYLTLTYTPSHS